jgi:hypothetical protein
MNRLASIRVCLLALACCASIASRAWPQIGFEPPDPVNPATYKSPSGVYALSVNPSDRYGRFGAKYRVTKFGNEVWSATLPFTLFQACITDAGVMAGYGYTRGEYGWGNDPRDSGPSEFVVAILDARGKARCKHFGRRKHGQGRDINLYPLGTGLIVDEANDRLIVRAVDLSSEEFWWTYRLSTGALVEKMDPARLMPHASGPSSILAAQLVKRTPLVLVHWWGHDNFESTGQFGLIDFDMNVVWSLNLPADYVVQGDRSAKDELERWIRSHGALLRTDQPRFDLFFAAQSKRVTFAVEQEPAGGWKVTEIARAPFSINSRKKRQIPTAPKRALRYLGPLDLPKTKPGEESPIRNVRWFTFDGRGRIAFLREDDKQTSLVVVDQTGKVAHEVPLAIQPQSGVSRWSGLCWVGGDRFVASLSETGVSGKARAWRIEPEQSKVEPLAAFDCPTIERLVGSTDGRFLVLATRSSQSGAEKSIAAFDSSGRRLWALHEGPDAKDPASLVGPTDIAVTPDRQLAVLEKSTNTLKFFDPSGRYLRTLDLEQAWNRKPDSPAALVALAGGFLIEEERRQSFDRPCFVQMMRDGTIIGGFAVSYPDGHSVNPKWGIQPSPEGDRWLADGHSLMRIGNAGVVDRDLVETIKPGQPRRVSAIGVDGLGCIYAVDARTGVLYVFDDAGKLLRVDQTKPGCLDTGSLGLTTDENGKVLLGLIEELEDAARHSAQFSTGGTCPRGTCHIQPGGKVLVARRSEEVELIDRTGKTIRTIDRGPDGHWLQDVETIAFAPDGSMAVLDAARDPLTKVYRADVSANLYTAHGDPMCTIRLSQFFSEVPRIAYDGRRLIVAGDAGVLLFDSSGALQGWCDKPPQFAALNYYDPYLLPGGRVLALFDGEQPVLHRYELP